MRKGVGVGGRRSDRNPGFLPRDESRLRQDLDEVAEFVFGVVGVGKGLAEFVEDGLAESFPEAMDGHLEGTFGEPELGGGDGLASGRFTAGEPRLELFEPGGAVGSAVFVREGPDGSGHQGGGPVAIELGGGGFSRGFVAFVEGFGGHPGAALEAMGFRTEVGEEMAEGSEEVGAEAAAVGIGTVQVAALQDVREELLAEFAGGVFVMPLGTERSEHGFAVGGAEFGERDAGLG
jgi:hypothetical protein